MVPHKRFMKAAITEALKSRDLGDYAVGAVLVKNNRIIARSGNRTNLDLDPTRHAEMVVIQEATRKLKTKVLSDCVIYTTNEPCPMCAAAIYWARVKGLIFGSTIKDMANFRKVNSNERWKWRTIDVKARQILNKVDSPPIIIGQFMREECNKLFHN